MNWSKPNLRVSSLSMKTSTSESGRASIPRVRSEQIKRGYAVRPLDGFNLDVAAGSLVILLGPSGCGKTTLLSCLGGILG